MKYLLIGRGKMGALIESKAIENGDSVIAALGSADLGRLADLPVCDCVIDFSRPAALTAVADYVRKTHTPLLSGTTGYTPEQMAELKGLGEYAPVLWSANFSLGIAVFAKALSLVTPALAADFDIEITETHHNQKADAPSGTALKLLAAIDPDGAYTPVYGRSGNTGKRTKKEIGIHALRGGTVAGTHTVSFFGPQEEFTITHRAQSREIFVNGALQLAPVLAAKEKGFYSVDELLFNQE